jgi:TetR/AcrR family transcriptional regulator, fatty acid metabolism regulator protein
MKSDNETHEQIPERTFIEQARRAQIVEHTIDVLAEYGHGKASLALIARHAGISKGVISYHFNGKADLLDQVEIEVARSIEAAIAPQVEKQETARDMLFTFIRANLEYMRDHRSQLLAIIEIFYMRASGEDRRPTYEAFEYEPVFEVLEEILRYGQETGEFGAFNTRVMSVAIWAGVEGMFTQWAAHPDLDLNEHTTELIALYDRATRAYSNGG